MVFDPFHGVGRDPRYAGTIRNNVATGSQGFGNNQGPTTLTDTTTMVLNGQCEVVGFFLSVIPSGGVPGQQGTNPRTAIWLNGFLIGQFSLPVVGSPGSAGGDWSLNTFLPGGQKLQDTGNILQLISDVDATNANGYTITRKVTCVTRDI